MIWVFYFKAMKVYHLCQNCYKNFTASNTSSKHPVNELNKPLCKSCERARFPKRVSSAIVEVTVTGLLMLVTSYLLVENLTQVALVAIIYTIPALLYILYTRKNFNRIQAFNSNKA
uniref:Aldehyde/histidinol dehydrogenase family protein n=1 Tax=uncultured Dokdonia sp. TaxID=575653 RepID=H6RFD7_9FLAO|nr:aldehyde/histidinol dehydrogenase family protein [uncultured Dokdonia sp.]